MANTEARSSVKIFILINSLLLISTINQSDAGSKSSKASSKTTVIAIDGGGGHSKAHPVPVPWPIIHCHHHHHHMKYVPKPMLVHHWVKKYKPYEIEANNEHLSMMPYESKSHLLAEPAADTSYVGPPQVLPAMTAEADLALNMMGSSSVLPSLGNYLDEQAARDQKSQLKPMSSDAHLALSSTADKGSNPIKPDQLAKFAKSLLNGTSSSPAASAAGEDTEFKSAELIFPKRKSGSTMAKGASKPSHPFTELQDQIEDESKSALISTLKVANAHEQNRASNIYNKFMNTQADRMRAVRAANSLLVALQNRPAVMAHRLPSSALTVKSTSLPAIGARAAGAGISESSTIQMMTKLAEQMAQIEARRLLSKQQAKKLPAASTANSTLDVSKSKRLLRGVNIFNLFGSSRMNREKRRASLQPEVLPSVFQLNRQHQYRSLIGGPQGKARAFGSLNVAGFVPSPQVDPLASQESSPSKHVLDLQEPESDLARLPTPAPGKSLANQTTKQDSSNNATKSELLNAEQEQKFYKGQEEHLNGVRQLAAREQLQLAKPFNSSLSPGKLDQIFNPSPSNFHDSIILPNNHVSASPESNQPTSGGLLLNRNIQTALTPWSKSLEFGDVPLDQPTLNWNSLRQQPLHQPAESIIPHSSYLEFPLSPQQWSTEALRSVNELGGEETSSGEEATLSTAELSSDSSGDQRQLGGDTLGSRNNVSWGNLIPAAYQQPESFANIYPSQTSLSYPVQASASSMPFDGMLMSQYPTLYRTISSDRAFYPPTSGAFLAVYNPYVRQQSQNELVAPTVPVATSFNGATTGVNSAQSLVSSASSSGATILNPTLMAKKAKLGGNQMALNQLGSPLVGPLSPWNPATNTMDPGLVASNDMNSLRQLNVGLSQAALNANNLTAMARLSQQLRDQMKTLQQRLPQMPNIPQPPQLPNLPMPPPGMMQMAGLALPFAMARATRNNRNRNPQVNAAVSGTGGSTGNRLLQGATAFTRRLTRPRRPGGGSNSSGGGKQTSHSQPGRRRRRFLGLMQTVVDMRRRPPGSSDSRYSRAVNLGAQKIKPKVDTFRLDPPVRRERSLRQVEYIPGDNEVFPQTSAQSYHSLVTMPDGSLAKFRSMTSPMTAIDQRLEQRRRELVKLRDSYARAGQEDVMGTTMGDLPPSSADSQLVPIPVVANHINLLLFAQNVTHDQSKKSIAAEQQPKALSEATTSNQAEEPEQQPVEQSVDQPSSEQQGYPINQAVQDDQVQNNKSPEAAKQLDETNPRDQASSVQSDSETTTKTAETPRLERASSFSSLDVIQQPESSEIMFKRTVHPTVRSNSDHVVRLIPFEMSPILRPPTSSKALTSTSTTTTTTIEPTLTTSSLSEDKDLRMYKWKRSTTRPKESIFNLIPERYTRSTPAMTTSTTEKPSEQPTAASADYVRAIKLVRGAAYPWPPPTIASNQVRSEHIQ